VSSSNPAKQAGVDFEVQHILQIMMRLGGDFADFVLFLNMEKNRSGAAVTGVEMQLLKEAGWNKKLPIQRPVCS